MKMLKITDSAHNELVQEKERRKEVSNDSFGQIASEKILRKKDRFEKEAVLELSILLEKHFKEIQKEWKKMFKYKKELKKKLTNADGAAKKMADTMMDNVAVDEKESQ